MSRRHAWQVGSIADIPIVVHPTFLLLLAWVILLHLFAGRAGLAGELLLILLLFACVVLHELSHALVARRFGIRTRKITLLPIGGVAQFERLPEKPAQELLVALAGPAASFVVALALYLVQKSLGRPLGVENLDALQGPLLTKLMWINIGLACFNLLPAFPMDGGRALRAALALRIGQERATHWAARVGQTMAVAFGLLGLLMNPLLVLIAVFVWVGAKSEATLVELKANLARVPITRAMITGFQVLEGATPLTHAIDLMLLGFQDEFPVVEQGRPLGVLTRANVVHGLATSHSLAFAKDFMERSFAVAEPWETLDVAMDRLQRGSCSTLLVTRAGVVVGILTSEHIARAFLLERALEKSYERQRLLEQRA